MLIKALKARIHQATVTRASVDYPGSIAIDSELLDAAAIAPYEAVLLANITNGQRAETYVIAAPPGSGDIEILGAAARLFNPGDCITIINFGFYTPEEIKTHTPKVIVCDEKNRIKQS
jgi:aspartate 1-decarboxylase